MLFRSNKLIGKSDASHGCTNIALADAIWLFNRVLPGDPVVTTGTVKKMEGWRQQITATEETVKFLESVGAIVNRDTGAQADKRLLMEIERMGPIIKAAGIEPQ